MDPDKTLDEIRKILQDGGIEDFGELADLIDALDEWMCRGGFLPEDSGRFSRFGIKGTYDSVWICMDCEQLEEDCERDTEEFMDYWGYP